MLPEQMEGDIRHRVLAAKQDAKFPLKSLVDFAQTLNHLLGRE